MTKAEILERLRAMPSSLNDALRTMDAAAEFIRAIEQPQGPLEPCIQAELDAWEKEKYTKIGRLLVAWMERALRAEQALAAHSRPLRQGE